MITLSYIDYDEALNIYYKTVEKSGGGQQAHLHHIDAILPGEERLYVSGQNIHGTHGGHRVSCGSRAYRS